MVIADSLRRPGGVRNLFALPAEVWPFGGAWACLCSTPAQDSQKGPCALALMVFHHPLHMLATHLQAIALFFHLGFKTHLRQHLLHSLL